MDVIDFWSKQVAQWHAELKCGFTWYYGAPLTQARMETQQVPPEFAEGAHVYITNYRETMNPVINRRTGLVTSREISMNMEVHILVADDIGKNVYNETLGHPISEGKWETILRPLRECLMAENALDFCTHVGKEIEITSWGLISRIDYGEGFTGWTINLGLREQDA